jgi:hypothetical protein
MLDLNPTTVAPIAGRILRPRAAIRPLRALRLNAIASALQGSVRSVRLLRLFAALFPDSLDEFHSDWGWDSLLQGLLHQCEWAGLFEPDWRTLDDLYDWATQGEWDPEEDGPLEPEAWALLAGYCDGIPVRHYHLAEDDWLEGETWLHHDLPGLAALYAAVTGEGDLGDDDGLVAQLGWINWDAALTAVDWPAQPEPLCWLPLAVRWCRRELGNPLLDEGVQLIDLWPEQYSWAQDIDRVWMLGLHARPVWQAVEAVGKWLAKNNNTERLLALLEDNNDDDI